jgi:hypothetical protein
MLDVLLVLVLHSFLLHLSGHLLCDLHFRVWGLIAGWLNWEFLQAIGFMYKGYKTLVALDENQELSGENPPLSCPRSFCTL